MDPLAIATAGPKAADNATVILWVVGVLMLGLLWLVRVVSRWVEEGRNECRLESAKAWGEVAARDAIILDLSVRGIAAQHATAEANRLLGTAIQELTNVVRSSGTHQAHT